MSELKPLPCPFCGHVGLDFEDGSTYRWGVASCGECGASTGEVRRNYPDDGKWHAEAIKAWNRRAQPAQAGQVLTDEEIDAAYEKARADYQRSRFAVRGQQLTAQDSPDWWFARAIEQAVLAKRVPMTPEETDAAMKLLFYPARNRAFIDGVKAAELHHGIGGEKGGA